MKNKSPDVKQYRKQIRKYIRPFLSRTVRWNYEGGDPGTMTLRTMAMPLLTAVAVTAVLPVKALAADNNQDYRRKVIGG